MSIKSTDASVNSSATVLLIDDDPAVLEMITEFLTQQAEGVNIITETDPTLAIERFRTDNIDCIVSDHKMPEMTGLTLLKNVREIAPRFPFIILTAKGDESVASRAISADVTEYFQKPSGTEQFETLANRITSAVSQYRRTHHDTERVERTDPTPKTTGDDSVETSEEFTGELPENGEHTVTLHDFSGDLRKVTTNCPQCGTDTAVHDIIVRNRCAGHLYDLTDCNAVLSLTLETRP
jgi:DNA-binding NarL/FixJ family response regulator